MNFRVGQKVVCINAAPHARRRPIDPMPLRKGGIYIIGGFAPHKLYGWDEPCMHLVGVTNVDNNHPFRQSRFLPVVQRKTDISIFKKLLVTSKQPMNVE